MPATNSYIQRLLEANPLREPLLRKVVQSLELPPGSYGLDGGCGIGLQALLLAEAVGPDRYILGVDIDSRLLAFGQDHASRAGCSARVSFCAGDVNDLPFEANCFDWVWSADCIGYPAGELIPTLKELVRVVKPGGRIIILAWSSQQLLPGYPLLEARLNATCSAYIPFLQGMSPEQNFLRALHAFHAAGLEDVRAQSFVGDVQPPIFDSERAALLSLFEMLWGQRQPEVAPQDWEDYQRLCLPGSPELILDVQDYYAFYTYTVFQGTAPLSRIYNL